MYSWPHLISFPSDLVSFFSVNPSFLLMHMFASSSLCVVWHSFRVLSLQCRYLGILCHLCLPVVGNRLMRGTDDRTWSRKMAKWFLGRSVSVSLVESDHLLQEDQLDQVNFERDWGSLALPWEVIIVLITFTLITIQIHLYSLYLD